MELKDRSEKVKSHDCAIGSEYIKRLTNAIQIGNKVKILDRRKMNKYGRFGVVVIAHVAEKYRYLVKLDNGLTVTYAQLAIWYKAGRRGYIS